MNRKTRHLEERRAFGNAIVSQRKQRKISQEALANGAGIDRSYMGRIEHGEQSVSLDKILDICDALSINPVKLFENVNE
jgi:transcriptional regulator with XRE-family HTH domain